MKTITIGFCRDCKFRDKHQRCNCDMIHEYYVCSADCLRQHLQYSYDEGGGFTVGEDFGCVHFQAKENA